MLPLKDQAVDLLVAFNLPLSKENVVTMMQALRNLAVETVEETVKEFENALYDDEGSHIDARIQNGVARVKNLKLFFEMSMRKAKEA